MCVLSYSMEFTKPQLKKGQKNYQPDWETEKIWVEVKTHTTAIRVIRDYFMQLIYAISDQEFSGKIILLLIEPNISYIRLYEEWQKAKKAFRMDVFSNIIICIFQKGQLISIPEALNNELTDALLKVCKEEQLNTNNPLPKVDYKAEIYKIIIYRWLIKAGPMTSDWLSKTVGCNYRTVANTLQSLGNTIIRHSDRSVELKYFPKDVWEWLIVNSNKSRLTKYYSDRSGHPRSIESLIKRLSKVKDIAIAGTFGSKHYQEDIDLIGDPRLDLTVHCPGKYFNADFIKKIDPALEEDVHKNNPASMALHFIRRKKPFFKSNPNGIAWADPVECLLDLHEMRLEPQALELLNYLQTKEAHIL